MWSGQDITSADWQAMHDLSIPFSRVSVLSNCRSEVITWFTSLINRLVMDKLKPQFTLPSRKMMRNEIEMIVILENKLYSFRNWGDSITCDLWRENYHFEKGWAISPVGYEWWAFWAYYVKLVLNLGKGKQPRALSFLKIRNSIYKIGIFLSAFTKSVFNRSIYIISIYSNSKNTVANISPRKNVKRETKKQQKFGT